MRGRERGRFLRGCGVRFLRAGREFALVFSLGELGEVAVVVRLHLQVEDFWLRLETRPDDERPLQQFKNVIADLVELILDLGFVGLDKVRVFAAFRRIRRLCWRIEGHASGSLAPAFG